MSGPVPTHKRPAEKEEDADGDGSKSGGKSQTSSNKRIKTEPTQATDEECMTTDWSFSSTPTVENLETMIAMCPVTSVLLSKFPNVKPVSPSQLLIEHSPLYMAGVRDIIDQYLSDASYAYITGLAHLLQLEQIAWLNPNPQNLFNSKPLYRLYDDRMENEAEFIMLFVAGDMKLTTVRGALQHLATLGQFGSMGPNMRTLIQIDQVPNIPPSNLYDCVFSLLEHYHAKFPRTCANCLSAVSEKVMEGVARHGYAERLLPLLQLDRICVEEDYSGLSVAACVALIEAEHKLNQKQELRNTLASNGPSWTQPSEPIARMFLRGFAEVALDHSDPALMQYISPRLTTKEATQLIRKISQGDQEASILAFLKGRWNLVPTHQFWPMVRRCSCAMTVEDVKEAIGSRNKARWESVWYRFFGEADTPHMDYLEKCEYSASHPHVRFESAREPFCDDSKLFCMVLGMISAGRLEPATVLARAAGLVGPAFVASATAEVLTREFYDILCGPLPALKQAISLYPEITANFITSKLQFMQKTTHPALKGIKPTTKQFLAELTGFKFTD